MYTPTPRAPPENRPRRPAPSWLRAAGIQSVAWLTVIALAKIFPLPCLLHALALQALLAGALAAALQAERWWIVLHLAFSPLALLALDSGVDPRWWLAALVICLLLFWGTPATRVPLYLSSRAAVNAVDALVQERGTRSLLDIGCGLASMLAPLARRYSAIRFAGIESAPLPWLISRLRTLGQSNVAVERGNFFATDWGDYDLVYAFLSPHPMPDVWHKAKQEMRAGSLLVSKDFAVPDVEPERRIALANGSTLYVYEIGTGPD